MPLLESDTRVSDVQDKQVRPVEVTIHFTSGRTLVTEFQSDSPLLQELFEALARRRGPGIPSPALQVPFDGGRRAFTFRSEHMFAIETNPPVVIQPQAQDTASQTPPAASPPRPPRRSPPVVREATDIHDPSSGRGDSSS